jgi:phosphoribosylanthranilate isomerase
MMKMKLKVCGMIWPENLRELENRVSPDFIGFIFYPKSKRNFFRGNGQIHQAIPPEKRVGVFVNENLPTIIETAKQLEISTIQLHGNETPAFCADLKKKGFRIIKAFGIRNAEDFSRYREYEGCCDFFLLDTKTEKHGGSGQKFDWQLLDDFPSETPYLLSGGIAPGDEEKIGQLKKKPFALDINSRFETEPGTKDIERILTFKSKLSQL